MSNSRGSATFNLCELYQAFRGLEEAFGYFADVLAGLGCELNCDNEVPIDPPSRDILDWLLDHRVQGTNGGGGKPCQDNPCLTDPNTLQDKIQEFASRAPGMADASAMLLKKFQGSEIKFLTLPVMRERG